MTSVLITGGTGFIGSRLALQCLAGGDRVRILAKRNTIPEQENCDYLERRGVQVVEGSVTDEQIVGKACLDVDYIYHLAAAQHEANVSDQYYYDINVQGTLNVLDAASKARIKRFVHGSTIGVYGISNGAAVSDHSPLLPDNIYGITKLKGEAVVRQFFGKLPIAIVRISETYGPGDRRLLKLFKGIQKRTFLPIGPGRNLHHPIYIDDLIDGLKLAASSSAALEGTFVLAGPRAVSTQEMILAICKAMNVDAPKLHLPLKPLMVAAITMEKLLRPIGVQPPLHPRRMNFFVKSFKFTCTEARNKLGHKPTIEIAEGMRRTLDWYRQMRLL